ATRPPFVKTEKLIGLIGPIRLIRPTAPYRRRARVGICAEDSACGSVAGFFSGNTRVGGRLASGTSSSNHSQLLQMWELAAASSFGIGPPQHRQTVIPILSLSRYFAARVPRKENLLQSHGRTEPA